MTPGVTLPLLLHAPVRIHNSATKAPIRTMAMHVTSLEALAKVTATGNVQRLAQRLMFNLGVERQKTPQLLAEWPSNKKKKKKRR